MPYIKQEDRDRLIISCKPETVGELNYLITLHCICFIKEYGESYDNYNRVVGILTRVQEPLTNHAVDGLYLNSTFKEYIFDLCRNYMKSSILHREDVLDDVIGVLESAKAEFQRRAVAIYEDKKIIENGDVY